MATGQQISIYGVKPLTEEEKQYGREQLYKWIEATINAELINPKPDYDQERYTHLLKRIALSDILPHQRAELIKLLDNEH